MTMDIAETSFNLDELKRWSSVQRKGLVMTELLWLLVCGIPYSATRTAP